MLNAKVIVAAYTSRHVCLTCLMTKWLGSLSETDASNITWDIISERLSRNYVVALKDDIVIRNVGRSQHLCTT